MTDFTWAIVNSLLRFFLTAAVSFELLRYGDMLNRAERWGLGLMGGSSFLTIAPILDVNKLGTPFDKWSTCLVTVGAVLYLIGRMTRHERHKLRNQQAAEYAAKYLERRGK